MKNTNAILSDRHFRPLSELNLMDNFLFQTIVSQKEDGEIFCRILLSTILGKPIRKVRIVPQLSILGNDVDRHGIRMDAYVEDISEEELNGCTMADAEIIPDIYDIEPNNDYEKKSLPNRMRYYQNLIDSKNLESSISYEKLPRVIIIVILPYDPFGKNRMLYTIKNQCVEDNTVSYEDGAAKIFLYTKGVEGNPSQKLLDMLKYIENTTTENVTNEDIHTIHTFVEKAKHQKEVGINYMKIWEEKYILRKEAFEEGLEEGRKESIKALEAERQKSINALIEVCQNFGQTWDTAVSTIIEKFELSRDDAEHYVNIYWKTK